jgi:hypothetical protein
METPFRVAMVGSLIWNLLQFGPVATKSSLPDKSCDLMILNQTDAGEI